VHSVDRRREPADVQRLLGELHLHPSVEVTMMLAGTRAARPGSSARRRPAT